MKRMFQDIKQLMAVALFAVLLLPMVAEAALSGQAGNTIIRNVVTVAYSDAAGTAQTPTTAGVDVTVTTVNANPSIVSISPASGISTLGTGDTYTYAVTVRTNSNGPGLMTLTGLDAKVGADLGTLTLSAIAPSFASTLFLGSTTFDPTDANVVAAAAITVANLGVITIAVPNDGGVPTDTTATGGTVASNGVINGLKVTDTVYITDGITHFGPFDVTAVSDPPVLISNTTAALGSLTLKNNTGLALPAFTPKAGWMIVESKSVNMIVTQGKLVTPKSGSSNYKTTITLSMGGLAGTASGTTVTTTATEGALTVSKYVRNVTAAVAGTGVPLTSGGSTYYLAGVSGKPGDTLEYAITVTNEGTSNADVVIASDALPAYTSLVRYTTGTGYAGTIVAVGAEAGTDLFASITNATETGAMTVQNTDAELNDGAATPVNKASGKVDVNNLMIFYIGNGVSNMAGGTIPPTIKYTIFYRVKVQ